jgi:hypothetical protein
MMLQHHYGTHLFGDDLAQGARLSVRVHRVHLRPKHRPKHHRKHANAATTEEARQLVDVLAQQGGQVHAVAESVGHDVVGSAGSSGSAGGLSLRKFSLQSVCVCLQGEGCPRMSDQIN